MISRTVAKYRGPLQNAFAFTGNKKAPAERYALQEHGSQIKRDRFGSA